MLLPLMSSGFIFFWKKIELLLLRAFICAKVPKKTSWTPFAANSCHLFIPYGKITQPGCHASFWQGQKGVAQLNCSKEQLVEITSGPICLELGNSNTTVKGWCWLPPSEGWHITEQANVTTVQQIWNLELYLNSSIAKEELAWPMGSPVMLKDPWQGE